MKIIQAILILTLLAPGSFRAWCQGPDPCACCSENHRAFAFWVGDWTVFDTDGKEVGTNTIVEMQDGCVLLENWVAAGRANTGTSYNYFDPADSTWNQLWISNTGYILELKGGPDSQGAMVLKGELQQGKQGPYFHQITWTQNEDGSVTQKWDIFAGNGSLLQVAFEGIYRKNN